MGLIQSITDSFREKPKPKRRHPKFRRLVLQTGPIKYHPGTFYDLHDPSKKVGEWELSRGGQVFIFYGMSKSGKSTIMRAILYCYSLDQYFVFGFVMSKTAGFTDDWACFPKKDIHIPDAQVLLEHIRRLQDLFKQGVQVPPNVIVLDDITALLISSREIENEFANFVPNCRHTNTVIIAGLHDYSASATIFRNNADTVGMLQSNDSRNDKGLHQSYGKYLPPPYNRFRAYEDWIPQYMVDHRALLFLAKIKKPEYYWFRSLDIPKTGWKVYPST